MRKFERPSFSAETILSNDSFKALAVPINGNSFPQVRDAEFYIRHDGLIVNTEGWFHPKGQLIGEVLYAPSLNGDKEIFGQRYRKVTLYPGTHTPVPYSDRAKILERYDSKLNQSAFNPFFAKYKQIFPKRDFIAYLPSFQTLDKLMENHYDRFGRDIEDLSSLLGIDLSSVELGITGGLLLGNVDGFHDIDLVFKGGLKENVEIARAMRRLVTCDPKKRIIEGGKGWNIRFYNNRGTFMCNFFSYKNPEDIPLKKFEMEVIQNDVQIEATVSDDTHTVYTPTVLGLGDVRVKRVDDKVEDMPFDNISNLIVYHTATRGECFAGDRIKARGALVNIKTQNSEYLAICVIDREGVRNMTPSWKGFYEDPISLN